MECLQIESQISMVQWVRVKFYRAGKEEIFHENAVGRNRPGFRG